MLWQRPPGREANDVTGNSNSKLILTSILGPDRPHYIPSKGCSVNYPDENTFKNTLTHFYWVELSQLLGEKENLL